MSRDETKRIASLRWAAFSSHCTVQPSTRLMRAVQCPAAHASTSKGKQRYCAKKILCGVLWILVRSGKIFGFGNCCDWLQIPASVGRLRLHLIAARESQPDPATKFSGSWVRDGAGATLLPTERRSWQRIVPSQRVSWRARKLATKCSDGKTHTVPGLPVLTPW